MESMTMSRVYLTTLTTAELVELADEYGIDIPEGLSRRFIIGELLEAIDEPQNTASDELVEVENPISASVTLPKSYNETQITALLRNPAWLFVYWDLNDSDAKEIQQTKSFSSFVLRVLYYTQKGDEKPAEVYTVPVRTEDRDRYIFLSQSECEVRIDLLAEFRLREPQVLAHSQRICIPKISQELTNPANMQKTEPILELSGLSELCRTHYMNHRQSFS